MLNYDQLLMAKEIRSTHFYESESGDLVPCKKVYGEFLRLEELNFVNRWVKTDKTEPELTKICFAGLVSKDLLSDIAKQVQLAIDGENRYECVKAIQELIKDF